VTLGVSVQVAYPKANSTRADLGRRYATLGPQSADEARTHAHVFGCTIKIDELVRVATLLAIRGGNRAIGHLDITF
jgi:hypothetical protein